MKHVLLAVALCLGGVTALLAQGNECAAALELTDVLDFCSLAGQYTITGATRGATTDNCAPGNRSPDVWFRFIAEAAGTSIKIADDATSTISAAQFAVYSGTCTALTQIGCGINGGGSSLTTFTGSSFVPGNAYFIRVFAQTPTDTGSFSLCVRSFAPGPEPTSDCAVAKVLCGKPTGFAVTSLTGAGNDRNEVDRTGCLPVESQSVWYSFTAANDGVLVFDLIPDLPDGDLDFILYELAGPPNAANCAGKLAVRCMASGGGRCNGPTGLRRGETDLEEASNCEGRSNAYVKELTLVRGRSYSLLVNNYDPDNPGFRIDFGTSTAIFEGPTADFTVGTFFTGCDTSFLKFDGLDSPGASYSWDFGPNAIPRTAVGQQADALFVGPSVARFVSLTVTNGCAVTITKRIEPVTPLPRTFSEDITPASCAEPNSGRAQFSFSAGEYTFTLDGVTNSTGLFTDLAAGTYELLIVPTGPQAGCEPTQTRTVVVPRVGGTATLELNATPTSDGCGADEYRFSVRDPVDGTTYAWDFGPAATPRTQSGVGPFIVSFATQDDDGERDGYRGSLRVDG